MSTCISKRGEYDSHEVDAEFTCTVCGDVDEDGMRTELQRLRRWKGEALPVMAGLQGLGKALGLGLGVSITGESAAQAARDLTAEVERLRGYMTVRETLDAHDRAARWMVRAEIAEQQVADLRGRVEALADDLASPVRGTRGRVTVGDLRALLAGDTTEAGAEAAMTDRERSEIKCYESVMAAYRPTPDAREGREGVEDALRPYVRDVYQRGNATDAVLAVVQSEPGRVSAELVAVGDLIAYARWCGEAGFAVEQPVIDRIRACLGITDTTAGGESDG